LQRGARNVKLERIPLELLFLLLEHDGQLVSREQMAAQLWGDDSLLDTERGINTAIRKIRKALGDDPHQPQFIGTVVGKGYRFLATLLPDNPAQEQSPKIQSGAPLPEDRTSEQNSEIRLRSFLIEAAGEVPVLTCEVTVGTITLGRLALAELELPSDVTLPLKPEDRLLLKLHGVRVSLTTKTTQAIHAFSISVLQSGLRTRVTDPARLSQQPRENPSLTESTSSQFLSPQKSQSMDTQ
jgi:DNA-binding winged helix-turn-helix (wHTH) protein